MADVLRLGAGALISAAGTALVFSPRAVAATLGRPYETVSQQINMRASWGGAVLGLGLFALWVAPWSPPTPTALRLVACLMVGIGAARVVGFVLDGRPDTAQWVWIVAEVLIAAACGLALARGVGAG